MPSFAPAYCRYRLECLSSGFFEAKDYWSTLGWPACSVSVPSGRRKKRSEKFPSLEDDIDYSIYVLFEVQFMYNPNMESSIYQVDRQANRQTDRQIS